MGIALGIGFALRHNAVAIVGGAVVGIILYVAIFGSPLGPDAGVPIFGLIGMTLLVTFTLRQSLASGRLSVLNWLVVAIGTVTYGAMIWIYYLGGWSILAH